MDKLERVARAIAYSGDLREKKDWPDLLQETRNHYLKLADAAIAALEPMDKPRVKPLEWEDFGDRAAKANAMLLTNYLIDRWSDGRFEVTVSSPGYGTGFDGKRWHDSMSEAKAAAQADYEARILAALEPVTVLEAARVLLEGWIAGEFEDSADAVADDAITEQWAHVDRTFPDAGPIIEAWLRALAERGE